MKRSLAFALCFLICFPAIPSLAEPQESYPQEAYSHLIQLGLLEREPESNPDDIVQRGEFAQLIGRMVNAVPDGGIILNFSDLDIRNPYYSSIASCVSMGYMNGYGDGAFRPEQPITGTEAVKVMVSLLEYDLAASYRGGYPYGYLDIAKEISLLKGCQVNGASLKKGTFIQLIYNVLTAFPNELRAVTNDTVTYRESSRIFAEHYLKLKHMEGIAEGDYTVCLTEHGGLDKAQILIDGTVYRLENAFQRKLVGKKVSCFYDPENNTIASLEERFGKNRELTVKSDEILSCGDGRLVYEANEKEFQVRLPDDLKYIYNNNFVMSYDFEQLAQKSSADVRFMDNNGDGRYEIAFVSVYETYVTGTIYSGEVIGDRIDGTRRLNLNEDGEKEILILDMDEKELSFSQIKADSALSVLENESLLLVRVNDRTISGTVDELSDSDKNGSVTLDGKTYPLSANCMGSAAVGQKAFLYFDCYDQVIYIYTAGNAAGYELGYLIGGMMPESDFEDLQIKLFLSIGSFAVYSMADKYKVNGEVWKERSFAPVLCEESGSGLKRQPIQFKLDRQGKVKDVLLPKEKLEKEEDGFFKIGSFANSMYQTGMKSFAGTVYLNDNTCIMQVPDDESSTDEKAFSIIPVSRLPYKQHTFDAYQYTKDSGCADLLILKGETYAITYDSGVAVCTGISTAADENGEQVSLIHYINANNAEGTVYVDHSRNTSVAKALSMNKGDVFQYASDINNHMTTFSLVCDVSEAGKSEKNGWAMNGNPTDSNFFGSFRMALGYAAKITGDYLRISYSKDFPEDSSVCSLEGHLLKSFKVTVIQSEPSRTVVRAGTAADVNIGDLVLVTTRSGSPRTLIVIKL